MINLILAGIIDQQAPSLCWHSAPVDIQRLSINAQRISGGTISHKQYIVIRVRRELNQPLNKLDLTHPMTPTLVRGGFNSSTDFF